MPRDELDAFDRLYLTTACRRRWDGAVSMLAGAGVGGGTTVNWTTCDRGARPASGPSWARAHGLDGFDGAEVDADFAAVVRELSVAPATPIPPEGRGRSCAAPTPLGLEAGPVARNASGCGGCGAVRSAVARGTKQSGTAGRTSPTGTGRGTDRARRPRRRGCSSRGDGSRASRRRSAGRRLRREPSRAASGRSTRRTVVVRAPQVVVAAGALRTPAILERSGLHHPAIGRYLRLHPVPVVAGLLDEPVDMWRGTMQAARSLAVRRRRPRPQRLRHRIGAGPSRADRAGAAVGWRRRTTPS